MKPINAIIPLFVTVFLLNDQIIKCTATVKSKLEERESKKPLVTSLLKPVGDLCNPNEVIVTPAKPIIPTIGSIKKGLKCPVGQPFPFILPPQFVPSPKSQNLPPNPIALPLPIPLPLPQLIPQNPKQQIVFPAPIFPLVPVTKLPPTPIPQNLLSILPPCSSSANSNKQNTILQNLPLVVLPPCSSSAKSNIQNIPLLSANLSPPPSNLLRQNLASVLPPCSSQSNSNDQPVLPQVFSQSPVSILPPCSSSTKPNGVPATSFINLPPQPSVLPSSNQQPILPLPRCSSCSGSTTPCSSCAAKLLQPQTPSSPPLEAFRPVPADAISQQLANIAREQEKIKIEGEIAFGFKTLPIELDKITQPKEKFPEELLFNLNNQVLEFTPEKIVYSKTIDPYRGTEVLMASKVPTEIKKLSLPELGYSPIIVEPPAYIRKDVQQEMFNPNIFLETQKPERYTPSCKNCVEPGKVIIRPRESLEEEIKEEKDNFIRKNPCKKCKQ